MSRILAFARMKRSCRKMASWAAGGAARPSRARGGRRRGEGGRERRALAGGAGGGTGGAAELWLSHSLRGAAGQPPWCSMVIELYLGRGADYKRCGRLLPMVVRFLDGLENMKMQGKVKEASLALRPGAGRTRPHPGHMVMHNRAINLPIRSVRCGITALMG